MSFFSSAIHTYLHLALAAYLAVYLSNSVHSLGKVVHDAKTFEAAYIFNGHRGELWRFHLSVSEFLSQGQGRLPVCLLMFIGLITSDATDLPGH